ncbi:MAG: hypothetical protein V7K50_12220 [Nostoc sp.]|uniref:hypothetical protein n=1 Tax=Nostoc sp. TaxID=1180 RepID=UPI002FF847FC
MLSGTKFRCPYCGAIALWGEGAIATIKKVYRPRAFRKLFNRRGHGERRRMRKNCLTELYWHIALLISFLEGILLLNTLIAIAHQSN